MCPHKNSAIYKKMSKTNNIFCFSVVISLYKNIEFMHYKKLLILIVFSILLTNCSSKNQNSNHIVSDTVIYKYGLNDNFECDTFNRDSIRAKIKFKKANKIPLVIHVFVPLCDNEHQGIVPTSKSLGDGFNLRTNLYWGAGYGIKTHFVRKKAWKLNYAEKDIDTNILERVIFTKQYDANTKVVLIADAYRGDRMENCLRDFFNAMAEFSNDTIVLKGDTVNLANDRDFFVFNGHNGLMDVDVESIENKESRMKDAAVISCMSFMYFNERLKCLRAYPLVTTQELLPPEAYILEGIIDAWAMQKSNELIRLSAGDAMYKVFKRNKNGMRNIFYSGW